MIIIIILLHLSVSESSGQGNNKNNTNILKQQQALFSTTVTTGSRGACFPALCESLAWNEALFETLL